MVVVVVAALRLDVVVVVERPTVLPLPVFPREGVEDVDAPLPPRDDELGVVVRRVVMVGDGDLVGVFVGAFIDFEGFRV